MFAHIPGVKVVMPSSPAHAYGLLLSAIRDPDPVIFLEPARLYRAARGEVADAGAGMPLETCVTLRQGRDVTIVSWGAMIKETLEAADKLAGDAIDAEVIDVATLKPLDTEAILASVRRTGRLVIVHEAPITCGYGAEIAARVAGRALTSLLAPIERVAGYDTMMPYLRTESVYMPNVTDVMAAARRTMAYA
jgi:pyruvate dehydrogenase E1 component beta subunit